MRIIINKKYLVGYIIFFAVTVCLFLFIVLQNRINMSKIDYMNLSNEEMATSPDEVSMLAYSFNNSGSQSGVDSKYREFDNEISKLSFQNIKGMQTIQAAQVQDNQEITFTCVSKIETGEIKVYLVFPNNDIKLFEMNATDDITIQDPLNGTYLVRLVAHDAKGEIAVMRN